MGIEHWVWLQDTLGPGSNKLAAVMARFDQPEEVFQATEAELKTAPLLTEADRAGLLAHDLTAAEKILRDCRRLGFSVMTCQSPVFPKRLLRIFNPPMVLYSRGVLPPTDDEVVISIVGTRGAGEESCRAAAALAARLTRAGVLIVSGGAQGVDGAAHRGALAAGGKTVAVLGGGLDINYPKPNAELRKEIAENGCLLSEYPPGYPPLPGNFPVRNRLIAALSLGVAIIEAGNRSGALLTAGHALEQGKDIFVLPGEEEDPAFAGSNQLLQDGARPLLSAMDILGEYADQYPHKLDLRTAFSPVSEAYRNALEQAALASAARAARKRKSAASAGKKPAARRKATAANGLVGASADVPDNNGWAAAFINTSTGVSGSERIVDFTNGSAGASGFGNPIDGLKKEPSEGKDPAQGPPSPGEEIFLPPGITDEARRLMQTLPASPASVDELSAASGLATDRILPAVTELELYGLLRALPGGRYALWNP